MMEVLDELEFLELREMPIYSLVVAKKGPKLTENTARGPMVKFNRNGCDVNLVFTGAPMDFLIAQLPRVPGADRPVLDKTGLTGRYDFQLIITDFQLALNERRAWCSRGGFRRPKRVFRFAGAAWIEVGTGERSD